MKPYNCDTKKPELYKKKHVCFQNGDFNYFQYQGIEFHFIIHSWAAAICGPRSGILFVRFRLCFSYNTRTNKQNNNFTFFVLKIIFSTCSLAKKFSNKASQNEPIPYVWMYKITPALISLEINVFRIFHENPIQGFIPYLI